MSYKILNNRFLTLYLIPFFLGILTVLSFQPFNFFFINFIKLPLFFYLIIFIKKNQKVFIEKNPLKIYLYLVQLLVLVFILVEFTG